MESNHPTGGQVCDRKITLAVAQRREARDWVKVYGQLHP
jgi:hypothetical protein